MRSQVKLYPTAALLLLLCTAIAATSAGVAAKPITLELWYHIGPPRDQVFKDLAAAFHATHPEITVNVVSEPQMNTKFPVAMAAGTGPDIINAHPAFTPNPDGAFFLPVPSQLISESEIRSRWESAAVNPWVWNGKISGLQYAVNPHIIFYNMDQLDEVGLDAARFPDTWEGIRRYASRLTRTGPDGQLTRSGFGITRGQDEWTWQNIVLNSGGKLFDEKGLPAFANTAGYTALQLMYDFVYAYNLHDDRTSVNDFRTGKIAMMEQYAGFGRTVPAEIRFGTALLPGAQSGMGGNYVSYGDYGFAVTRTAQRRGPDVEAAAWEFFKFLSSVDSHVALLGLFGMPVRRDVIRDARTQEWLRTEPYFRAAIEQTGVFPIRPKEPQKTLDAWAAMVKSAMRNGVPIRAAVDEAARQIADLQK